MVTTTPVTGVLRKLIATNAEKLGTSPGLIEVMRREGLGQGNNMGKRNQRNPYPPTILVKKEKVTQKMKEVPQYILCSCLIEKAHLPIKLM